VAAICRSGGVPGARVTAWFESAPAVTTSAAIALVQDRRVQGRLPLPPAASELDRDVLHVSIDPAQGARLWHKAIPTMLVHRRPPWPEFGAAETQLRYEAPISVRAEDGTFSSLQWIAIRVLAGVQLCTILGWSLQYGLELRVGRD
jgi:hypothetical protein